MKKVFLVFVVVSIAMQNMYGQNSNAQEWASIDNRQVPSWFEDAKFGIFIHWGVYSVPAYSPARRDSVGVYDRYAEHYWRRLLETSETQHYFQEFHKSVYGENFLYQDFAPKFKAEMYQPREWAKLFEKSGAKYVVLTSKHHDGYTLWPSRYSWNWNAVDVGSHRDLAGELTIAVRKQGLRMGFYYSLLEWFHPLYKKETINEYVSEHMIPQMKELVERYKPDVLWTDGEWDYPSEIFRSTSFLDWLYSSSSVKKDIVVNDRWGSDTRGKHGGFYTTEYDLLHGENAADNNFEHPWEECRGIGGSFGYNRHENIEDYSTSEELIHVLINKVARGGNLLLNIGPTADGRIPVIMQERLMDIGDWLNTNGEAIYETRKWNNAPALTNSTTKYFTKKGNDLYLLLTKWQDAPIEIDGVANVQHVTLLGYSEPIKFSVKKNSLSIIPPNITPSTDISSYAWVFKIQGVE